MVGVGMEAASRPNLRFLSIASIGQLWHRSRSRISMTMSGSGRQVRYSIRHRGVFPLPDHRPTSTT